MRYVAYSLLVLLYAVHTDVWFWDDPTMIGSLPIGMAYHLAFMLASSVVLWMLVKFAWPAEIETEIEAIEAASTGAAAADTAADDSSAPGERGTRP